MSVSPFVLLSFYSSVLSDLKPVRLRVCDHTACFKGCGQTSLHPLKRCQTRRSLLTALLTTNIGHNDRGIFPVGSGATGVAIRFNVDALMRGRAG